MKTRYILQCWLLFVGVFIPTAKACHPVYANISGPTTVCVGQSITFSGEGSSCQVCYITSYSWSGAASGSDPNISPTFGSPGAKTIYLTVTCSNGVTASTSKTFYVVRVNSVTTSKTTVCTGENVTFTAVPYPAGKSLGCMQWEGRYREDSSVPYSDWGTVALTHPTKPDGSPDHGKAILSAGTPGYYQVQARNGSSDTWKYSAEVLVDFDIELISPGDGHKVVYSSDPNGVLTLNCSASLTCGHTVDPNLISFDCEAIGNSVKDVGPVTLENGIYSCIITFTHLPENNSDFGPKTVSVKYNGVVKDSNQIEVYFPHSEMNWPGAAPIIRIDSHGNPYEDWGRTAKNWYYYYKQTWIYSVAPCEYSYQGSRCMPWDHPNYTPYVGAFTNNYTVIQYTDSRSGISVKNSGETMRGINEFAYASFHEYKHHEDYTLWWGAEGIQPDDDIDGDRVPDYLENGIGPAEGGPYYNWTQNTHPQQAVGGLDDQAIALFGQLIVFEAEEDWAYPGSKWY